MELPGKALAIELDLEFNLAYVAADEGGLRIIDISAPDLPREVGSVELPDGVQQLYLRNQTLAVSSGDRIVLVDVTRPDNPVQLGEYAPPRQARRVRSNGQLAFVADLDGGLKIFDLADPNMPLLIYGETSGSTYDVLASGNRVFLADGANGVRILDVGNPAAPRLIAQVPLDGIAQGLDIWDDVLAVAAGDAGLYLISLTNEYAPVLMAQVDTEGDAQDVRMNASLAYVADGEAGLAIISLLDRWDPQLRSTLYTPGEARALGLVGTFVYVAADDGGLQIVDAIRPAAPFMVGALTLPEGQHAVDIAVINKRAYLAIQGSDPDGTDTGLAIADVGFRDQPTILSRVSGPAVGVAVYGVDVVTVGGGELMTVDARASSGPVLMGHYVPPAGAGGMAWDGETLYFSSGGEGPELVALDTVDPGGLQERFLLNQITAGGQVTIADPYVYVAAGSRGLRALDAQNPQETTENVIYDPMDTLLRLFTYSNEPGIIYGAGEAGWSIASVESPQLPRPLSRVQTDAPVSGLARNGTQLYAVSAAQGLFVYDVADLMGPQLVGRWTGASLRDVLVNSGYLYATDRQVGLRVFNTTPADRPRVLQTIPLSNAPGRIVPLSDNRAYVLPAGSGEVSLVDLGSPTTGVIPQSSFAVNAASVQVDGVHAYSVSGDSFAVWSLEQIAEGVAEPLAGFDINGTELTLAGNMAFVGSEIGHVSLIDVSNPNDPRVQSMMSTNAAVRSFLFDEENALLTAGLERKTPTDWPVSTETVGELRTWDVSDPRQPQLLSTVEMLSPFIELDAMKERPRLVAAGSSLVMLDVSDPLTATQVAELTLPAPAQALHLDGDVAYVGTASGLLVVAGLASDAPSLRAQFFPNHSVTDVVVRGQRAYLVIEGHGAVVVDLDQGGAELVANLPAPAADVAQELLLYGDQLWVVWDGWVSWLDVGRPETGPAELDVVDLGDWTPSDLMMSGNRAYLTDEVHGLSVWDVSDPAVPALLGSLDTPGHAYAFAVDQNDTGFVADGECGIRVVDLSDPTVPAELGFWQGGFALDVAVQNGEIYVADVGELVVLAFDPAGAAISPPLPQSPQPADDAMFYSTEIQLAWDSLASDCDPLTFELYLGTKSPPPLLATGLTDDSFLATDLERRTTYYWQIVATDRQGDQTAGPIWTFHTRTEAQPPAEPTPAPAPELMPAEQEQVPKLVGFLALAGVIVAGLWWLVERPRRQGGRLH